jgi:antitoxin (DNA-binding transcriptional repressor) of toxin-antitoxin stability system
MADARLLPSDAMNVSVEEIEKDPREYVQRVLEGETVIVFEKDRAVAEMRPLAKRAGTRPIGLAKGDFVVPDDFNDPLPDDVLQLFEGE